MRITSQRIFKMLISEWRSTPRNLSFKIRLISFLCV
nr:MAG TPA: hypothetical protein [Caudoviricetes sp.]